MYDRTCQNGRWTWTYDDMMWVTQKVTLEVGSTRKTRIEKHIHLENSICVEWEGEASQGKINSTHLKPNSPIIPTKNKALTMKLPGDCGG